MHNVQDNQREATLAYLAGILDGEGSFNIKYNKKTDVYFTCISVGMTELPAIELMAETFGGKIRVESSGRNKDIYRWESNSAQKNRHVLEAVQPYVRVKKDQVLALLECVSTIRSPGGGEVTTPETKQRRKEFYLKVKELHAAAPATTNRANI